AGRAVGQLTGDADRQALNFLSNRLGPRVPVPVRGQAVVYKLYREAAGQTASAIDNVTVERDQNEVQISRAVEPGNYTLKDDDSTAKAWFSVNLPVEETNLTRVGKEAVEAVLGPEALLAVGTSTNLGEAMQGHVSKPLELLPWLMVGLLLVLAVENL